MTFLISLTFTFLILITFFKNPIYSVFSFILFVFFVMLFFLLLSAEFLAYLLLIIYVGAIAVLFLFSIILLNLGYNLHSHKQITVTNYAVVCLFLFGVVLTTMFFINVADVHQIFTVQEYVITNKTSLETIFGALDVNLFTILFSEYFSYLFFVLLILYIGIIGTAVYMRNK